MSVKIDGGMMGPSNMRLNTQMTTARQTPNTTFGARVQSGLNNAAGAVGAGVGAVAGMVPGGSIVSAAVSSAQTFSGSAGSGIAGGPYAGTMSAGAGSASLLAGSGAVASTNVGGSTGSPSTLGTSGVGGSVGDQVNGNFSLGQMQNDNVKLLNLQAAMQHESQVFTAVSNVMKSRHDTIKNSIGNVR
ncbi:hypothetical protein DRW03_01960 [Corallococcus sp. H22C18031201]|uniref:hypothetical protein n=1 Tax=Citreicoccus inhibens TaxID=2849499 RepID=UPI000E728337|nr:hypothetical protein [Citreicoccus inhibens]MBU8895009.1 hypothetical protein [Citreicoccus inhibens]RJS27166.1 hypothetical protein DRW03_01960 [Corallococcus sp. H22C18031201]